MSHTRRFSTVLVGLALSVPAFAATAPAAFAIIPGPAHVTTFDGRYNPPAPVAGGQPATRQSSSNAQGHPVATGPASVPATHGPGQARHHGGPGRQARHEARRQPVPQWEPDMGGPNPDPAPALRLPRLAPLPKWEPNMGGPNPDPAPPATATR
jgi:hypothetical protein